MRSVTETKKTPQVVRKDIVSGLLDLSRRRTIGQDSLLIVHLIGHGASDRLGGLLLSDAQPTAVEGRLTRFDLNDLSTTLRETVFWPGGNVMVFSDFCNSGALIDAGRDLTQLQPEQSAPVPQRREGLYARQIMTSSLRDASAYVTVDGRMTRMTELLLLALGSELRAFPDGQQCITAVQLRRCLTELDRENTFQAMLVARIWNDWTNDMTNEGDIFFFRNGCGSYNY